MNFVEKLSAKSIPSPTLRLASIVNSRSLIVEAKVWLSEREQQRAGQFLHQNDRDRFILGRAIVRDILYEHYGLPPDRAEIQVDHLGKPYLPTIPNFDFSISHSGEFVLVGAGTDIQLGVDIENHKAGVNCESIGEYVFSSDELQQVFGLTCSSYSERFYRQWTAKEALLKALGVGLTAQPKSFGVDLDTKPPMVQIPCAYQDSKYSDWIIKVIDAPKSYSAAAAWRTKNS